MAFKKDTNQRKAPPGFTRYRFDIMINGRRERARVLCRSSEVHRVYCDWVEEFTIRSGGEPTSLYALFRQYLDVYVRVKKSRKQYLAEVSFFENRFTKCFAVNMQIGEFRRSHVERYIAWRSASPGNGGKVSKSTLNKDINILSSFLSWAIRNEYYARINPCKGLRFNEENERRIRLMDDEIAELVSKVAHHQGLCTAVMIGTFTGLRKSEITGLRWCDVDLKNALIEVRAETSKGTRRGHLGRTVPMPDVLVRYLKQIPREGERVAPSPSTIKRQFERVRDSLSFTGRMPGERFCFNDIRHVYAQLMRDSNVSLDDLQHLMGHSSPVVTHKRYAQAGGYDGHRKVNLITNIVDTSRIADLTDAN